MQPNENHQQLDPESTQQNVPQLEPPRQLNDSQPSTGAGTTQPVSNTQDVEAQQLQPQHSIAPSGQINVPTQPNSTTSIYPEPRSGFAANANYAGGVSKSSFEKEGRQRKKRKQLLVSLTCLVAALLVGAGGYLYWYSQQDHSMYAKLTTETYNQNGVKLSFQYPAIMAPSTATLNASIKSAFQYESGTTTKVAVVASAVSYASILQHYAITPAEELSQLQSGQGSYADALKAASPTVFNDLYTNCKWFTTNSGQKDLMCSHQDSSYGSNTVVNILGADNNYQYGLTLGVSNDIWSAHPKVWQKIEKSFSY